MGNSSDVGDGIAIRNAAFWVFASFLILYIGLTRGHFWTTDEIEVYQQTESLVEHGNLAVSPVFANAVPGRGGKTYAPYGIGQSILSIPLYLIGRGTHYALEELSAQSWIKTFAGPTIGQPGKLWGGLIEIFFVNLFNAIAGAALMTLFFLFSYRLGAEAGWALAATAVLGLATNLTGLATGYFQHIAEALFALWSFYLLHEDRLRPALRTRLAAGLAACLMLMVRPSTVAFLPALLGYFAWNTWQRNGPRTSMILREAAPFVAGIGAGLLMVLSANYFKFGEFSLQGSYSRTDPFDTPWTVGLYGLLYSPGESFFLFSPPVLLAPWWMAAFLRKRRAETMTILCMALAYLATYARAHEWYGGWTFGPRYLSATLPLLLLPLGVWLQNMRPDRRRWLTPVWLFGSIIATLHIFVNVSYVYFFEGYDHWKPEYGFLYIPAASQIPAHLRALLAWDNRVDFWLLNVFRDQGAGRLAMLFVPLAGVLAFCLIQLRHAVRRIQPLPPEPSAANEVACRSSL